MAGFQRKGEYEGEWYLGVDGERRVRERRERILAARARADAEARADPEPPEGSS
jgi:hypothetical protein